jgi:hypothetical protein
MTAGGEFHPAPKTMRVNAIKLILKMIANEKGGFQSLAARLSDYWFSEAVVLLINQAHRQPQC